MENTHKKKVLEIQIEEFSKKGSGLGSFENSSGLRNSVEVPFAIPGDKVCTTLLGKRQGRFKGKLDEIIEPSPDRITPRCAHFGVCGGCCWQQISYEKQLKNKEELVRQAFANLLNPHIDFKPILACDSPWNYRNKMEFSFSSDSHNRKFLGLIMDSSKGKVFNINECHLANSWFMDAVHAIREWWLESNLDAYHQRHDVGSLRTVILREGQRTGDRMVMLTVSGNPDYALQKQHLESFVAFLRDAIEPVNPLSNLSIFLRIQQIAKGMATNFYEMLLYGPDQIREILQVKIDPDDKPVSLTFLVSPTAFFQPNTQQAEQLYSTALQMAKIPKDGIVYDLYCGTGTLGICAAKQAKQVIGVEISPESALDARTNAARNGFDNVTIISGAVRHVLHQIREEKILPQPDIVMIDPPRAGLDPLAMRHLLEMNAPKILSISCNPVTQAANIAQLIERGGYTLKAVQPIDQFPQTFHVETVAVLERITS
jgi:23S rRNA (uracil1939-C5)-methyltransferase